MTGFGHHIGRVLIAGVALATATLGTVPPVSAMTPDRHGREVEVSSYGPAKTWHGTVYRDAASNIKNVPECTTEYCDVIKLEVELPKSVWSRKGGVEVSTRWQTEGFDDSVGLYVYRGGQRVAKSDGLVATAQSVQIRFNGSNPNGKYFVYIANNSPNTPLSTPQIDYDGLAEVEYDPVPAAGQTEFLPDLRLHPSPIVTFDTPDFGVFETPPPPGDSCFGSERTEDGAYRCLRYDIESTNAGTGNLELEFRVPHGLVPTDGQEIPVKQRIYRTDGTSYLRDSGAVVEWHAVHGHWHFKSYAQANLIKVDDSNVPIPGVPALPGSKPSFCIADTRLDAWAIKGNGPTNYPAPDCLSPKYTDPATNEDVFTQGLTRGGFGDTYNWFLNGQYINVPASATDGRYMLKVVVDPDNYLKEMLPNVASDGGAGERNNCSTVIVQLSGLATTHPTATRVGDGPACTN